MKIDKNNTDYAGPGTHYRLGILTGRLKAYEREEDLVEILKRKK
jgi:hypothetical protein